MKKKYVISIIIIVILLISLLFCLFYPPKFTLNKGNITLKYGTKFQDPGVTITKFGHNYTEKVKINNKINPKKLGTYDIIYQIKIFGITFEKTRKVTIVDKEKPEITLNGSQNITICPNAEYKEEGYKATDNYDGDITNKVKLNTQNNIITYSVQDSSNNKTTITRTITKEDKINPTITLKGSQNQTIYTNSTWQEPGYTVSDNCDNNLNSNVIVNGKVNTKKAGTYKITYTVKDLSGNTFSVIRTIKVINKPVVNNSNNPKPSKKGVIYLTFDDGPNEGTTNVILDILKQNNVKATFFVTGKGPDSLIQREYQEGHAIALHTFTHNYETVYKSVDNYLAQIQNRVKKLTGTETKIIRFPGGSSNTVSKKYSKGIMSVLTKDVVSKGYHYFDWNVDSDDAGGARNSTTVYNNVIKGLSKNRSNIVLMHDVKPQTRDALNNIIKYGKNNGYTFEKITMQTPMVTHKVNN